MSTVTLGDQAKCLAMVGSGSQKRDLMLLSLAQRSNWTARQRELIATMWREHQAKKEAAMQLNTHNSTLTTAGALVLILSATAFGCAATYEKRFVDHEGRQVVIVEEHDPDWWNTLGTPDWMDVRHEVITRDGKVVTERYCRHEPVRPQLLDCTPAR